MSTNKKSFRSYVNDLWYQHQDEIEYFEKHLPNYDRKEWFDRAKWWLKREYRLNQELNHDHS